MKVERLLSGKPQGAKQAAAGKISAPRDIAGMPLDTESLIMEPPP